MPISNPIIICMIVHAYYLKDARVRRYAESLVGEGHKVDIICLREGSEPHFEEHRGVRIYRINKSRNRSGLVSYILEYFSSFVRFFIKLNMLFFSGNYYKIIHIHNFPNFLVFAAVFQKMLGKKIILDVHDPMPELFSSKYKLKGSHAILRMLNLEERLSAKFADFVITANHSFMDLLAERGVPANKMGVVLNAPDENLFDSGLDKGNSNRKSGIFNVLYVGTLAERYGIETSLRAIAELKKEGIIPGLCFTVIPKIKNEGEYVDRLLGEVKKLELDDCFHLLDPVPHHQMPQIIRDADLSVYTPLKDVHMDIALSLKIPEIIALGKPLVASRLSVLQRYFGEDSLFMCEPGNVEDCAEKILEVYRNPEETRLRVDRGRKALDKIAWKIQKKEYLNIIYKLRTVEIKE